MKKVSEMNGNERIAWKNIKGIFDWNVGGWYNCIQDGCPEDIPATRKEAAELIYEDALENTARPGYYGMGKAPKEMRFAGREFIMECIEYLLDTDGDAQEIAAEIWNKTEEKKEEPKVRTAEERPLAFWERYEIVGEIRNACIRNQFYTRGTNEEYDRMFQMAKRAATWQEVDEVIRDIYLHSDTDEKEFEYSEVFKAISKVYNDVWSRETDMPSDDSNEHRQAAV